MDGEGLIGKQSLTTFILPAPPPSMNSAYNVLFAMRRVEMKPEVRQYKTMMKVYVPKFNVSEGDKVSLEFKVSQDWFYKNGKMKKQDVQNMVKVLIDLIAEKQGWDDSQVWSFKAEKDHDPSTGRVSVKQWILQS
jgi:Holliday junction resolvase RusA-like endonuclease